MTDWTDRALDFLTIYDEEKSRWQIGRTRAGRAVVVRHDLIPNNPLEVERVDFTQAMLTRQEFRDDHEARHYIRAHAVECALKELFADRVEVALR